MRLSRRRLNRTLLQRQHLLERVDAAVVDEARHLVGLQAQENLPPYLSLAARLSELDPADVTRGLEDRTLVRLLTMRGTIHLLAAEDALPLRAWTQPRMEQELRSSQNVRGAADVDRAAFAAALRAALADGPLAQKELAQRLAEAFPDRPATALGQVARLAAPLAQLPPRGCWKRSGGVVYQYADAWLGRDGWDAAPPDVPEVVRRYLRAFGPATAADVTAWSAVTRLGPVLAAMTDLVRHEDDAGRTLYDVPDGELADEDVPAPVRLLGCYDNVWLSHARRDRVTDPEKRNAWMGVNGGTANALFVDGWLEGLWRVEDGRVHVLETLRPLTRSEQSGLASESARVERLLAR
ncbi:winged helix DNA-binding domain-containing protein [Nocardioides dongkuii]|uniref:winged helix DNA-binding domain-containing protein n=1 Tax=Nocardioides dongkuii TaxID=2760089 RepID=UPI0015FA5AA3|nr:winged helix DNA-binding domain-containing protein [Nocardioides dongkuii]